MLGKVYPEKYPLRLDSPEGDGGVSSNVSVRVRYTFDSKGTLSIDSEGATDARIPLNLAGHGYLNMNARTAGR
jgi:galactose mutarotase-like enzyme